MTEDFEGGNWGEGVPTGSGDAVDYGAETQFAGGQANSQPGQQPIDQPGYQPMDQPPVDSWQQQPPMGSPPQHQFEGNPYIQPQFSPYERADGTQTAMLVSVISLVLGFFCTVGFVGSPFGMVMGKKELNAIDAGLTDPINRSTAMLAFVLGIIGTAFLALLVVGMLVFIGLLIFGAASA